MCWRSGGCLDAYPSPSWVGPEKTCQRPPDGEWTPIVMGPLSNGQSAWGCLTQARLYSFTYQGPGGTYSFGANLYMGDDIVYTHFPRPFNVPASATPKRFDNYYYSVGVNKINAPTAFMQSVVSKRHGTADLVIYIYKGLPAPDGITPWQVWVPEDKVVATWTWPNAFRL